MIRSSSNLQLLCFIKSLRRSSSEIWQNKLQVKRYLQESRKILRRKRYLQESCKILQDNRWRYYLVHRIWQTTITTLLLAAISTSRYKRYCRHIAKHYLNYIKRDGKTNRFFQIIWHKNVYHAGRAFFNSLHRAWNAWFRNSDKGS